MVIPVGPAFANLFVGAIIVVALYLARDVLIPIVLAVLLTFVLTPVVTLLQRWHVPRTAAVSAAVVLAVMVLFSLGTMVATQINQLATELPRYQTTLREKVQNLRDQIGTPGVFRNAATLLDDLSKELDRPPAATITVKDDAKTENKPMPVEIHHPQPTTSQRLLAILAPLVAPLTMAGLVLLFATFFLFQREDLRNRVIRLAGARDIERTTAALNDAGWRLQRLFATQLLLNAGFGLIIGLGLAVIGVPNAPLWGVLAMILRFVPYVGAILCALLPLTVAAAVGDGWSMVLWTFLLFAIVEPLVGQVIEPLAYGHRTGLTPVAVVLSAVFWTWLWGPIGLLVSTPLTLCIVVLARHVDRLKFIDIMFGDQPPLNPQQVLYQRMLAGDPVEAADHAARALKKMDVFAYCENVLLGALKLAQADLDRGRLDAERLGNISHCFDELLEDFSELETSAREPQRADREARKNVVRLAARDADRTIVALPGRGKLDRQAALVVAFILARDGFRTTVPDQSTPSLADFSDAAAICICHVSPIHESLERYTIRRVRRSAATHQLIIVALGGHPSGDRASNAPPTATSLREVIDAVAGLKTAHVVSQAKPD